MVSSPLLASSSPFRLGDLQDHVLGAALGRDTYLGGGFGEMVFAAIARGSIDLDTLVRVVSFVFRSTTRPTATYCSWRSFSCRSGCQIAHRIYISRQPCS